MGEFQIKQQPKKYDVIIVGSGAGGGMAAYVLANAGLKICIIEAGPMYDPQKNVTQLKNPWDSPRRGASTKNRPFGDFDACYGGWSLEGEPFTKEKGTTGPGGAQECSVDVPTIGEGYHYDSVPKILKEKVLMVLAKTGPSVMKI